MKKIRKNVFETNSSSTHAICICEEDEEVIIPEKIEIELKDYNYEFGWEYKKWDTLEDKLAYIILGIISRSCCKTSFIEGCVQIEKLLKMLKDLGVKKVKISGLEIHLYDKDIYLDNKESYVDHASEMGDLIEEVLSNEFYLKNYLFNNKSFILGGNDNDEGYQEINVDYDHLEFYKGN